MLAWDFMCYVWKWLYLDKADILTTHGYQSEFLWHVFARTDTK